MSKDFIESCKLEDIPDKLEDGKAFHKNAIKAYIKEFGWHEVFDKLKNSKSLKNETTSGTSRDSK